MRLTTQNRFAPPRNPVAAQAVDEVHKHALLTGGGDTAASVLAPVKPPFTVGKPEKVIDINHLHVSSCHQHEHLLRGTAQLHGITMTGVLQPFSVWFEAKKILAATPRRTTSPTGRPMETVNVDLSSSYEAWFGRSGYLIMLVDSASRWMRPHGTKRKSETNGYSQTFLADINGMRRPSCIRTDNDGEFTNRDYVGYCDSARFCHEYGAPGKPQQNTVVHSAIYRDMKGGHTARLEIGLLFPVVDLGKNLVRRHN